MCIGHGIWKVTSKEIQYIVDINNHKCRCFKWDVTGVPCLHVVVVIHQFKHKPKNYMSLFFTRKKYTATYKGMITPILDKHSV
jgi:zinc finger SWIM domain-containing protein 3